MEIRPLSQLDIDFKEGGELRRPRVYSLPREKRKNNNNQNHTTHTRLIDRLIDCSRQPLFSTIRPYSDDNLIPAMSEAYERERQNNARLDELSAKVSALRGVTVDIYDNARAQDVIDNTVRPPLLAHPLRRHS